MKKFMAVFIGVVLVLLCAAPVLAAGFSLSPAEVEFDVPADGSARVEFLVYDFGGDLEVSLENIPLRIEPEKVSVVASEEGTPIELTFYGDESLGPQVFKGKILFLASSGGNIAFGVMVKTTVNHIAAGQPLLEVTSPIPEEALPPLGTTNVRGIVSLAGVFLRPVSAISENGLCTLTIPAGTIGLTEELERLTIITMLIMDEPPPPPEASHVIGLAYDFQPSGATFEPAITLTFTYDLADIPEGIAEEDLVLAYYDQKAGEWVNLEVTVDTETNTITVLISHFTAFTILGYEVPEPAAFTPSSLVISPTEVDIGQAVNVSLSVANTGGMAGSYKVTLKIDGEVEATQQVTVGPGASETVTFTTSRDVAGSYSVDVNGLSGSFTIREEVAPAPPAPPPPAPPPEVKPPVNWPLVGGSIAGVVVVGLVIFFLIRKRTLTKYFTRR